MKQRAFVTASFLVLTLDSTAADFREPTDVELKASYCIGLVQEQLRELDELRAITTKDRNSVRELRGDKIDTLKRLNAYVLPRVAYVDPVGMMAARAEGLRAVRENTRRSQLMSDKTSACMKSECVRTKSEFEADACVKNCQADPCFRDLEGSMSIEERFAKCDPLYSRELACYKLEWLPF